MLFSHHVFILLFFGAKHSFVLKYYVSLAKTIPEALGTRMSNAKPLGEHIIYNIVMGSFLIKI